MLSSANIEHGIMLAFLGLIGIILLIIAGVLALFRMRSQNKSETKDMVILILFLSGLVSLLLACS